MHRRCGEPVWMEALHWLALQENSFLHRNKLEMMDMGQKYHGWELLLFITETLKTEPANAATSILIS